MRAAARGAWIAGWLMGWVALARVQAQGAPEPSSTPAATVPEPQPRRSSVLFLLPSGDDETEARLRDAVLAQFALLDVQVVFEPAPELEPAAEGRTEAMQARASSQGALAAFSIDARADGRWYVYLLDVERQRLLVRALEAGGERRDAAIEAVALMTRESTRALLEGAPMPEPEEPAPPPRSEPSAPPAPPPAPPAPPEHKSGVPPLRGPPPGGLRLWLGYGGTDFADKVAARHAVAVGAGWLGFAPWYIALGGELAPPIEFRSSDPPVAFQVLRVPFRAYAGHRYREDPVVFDLELALTAELLHRSSGGNQPVAPGVVTEPHGSANDWLVGLGPRARVEVLVFAWAGLAAELGFDAMLNSKGFRYLYQSSSGYPALLRPLPVRPFWALTMAFYP